MIVIPSDLLIQVEPIRWIGGFSIYALLSGILVAGGLSLLYHLAKDQLDKSVEGSRKKSLLETIPSIESSTFERDAALLLKNAIHILYLPKRSQAHTLKDVSIYVSDPRILESLEKLERAEYRDSILPIEERREVLDLLSALTSKIKNPTK